MWSGQQVSGQQVSDAGDERHGRELLAALVDRLRAADRAVADALELLMAALDRSVAERLEGLPTEQLVGLDAGRTRADRRMLVQAATVLPDLPATWSWFRDGTLSWSQVRATVAAAARLDRAQRAWLDAAIAATGERLAGSDPDRFVDEVTALADTARDDLADDRREAAYDRRFVAVQPALDGATAAFYGEGDAETVAVIVEAMDAAAHATHHGPGADGDPAGDQPADPDHLDPDGGDAGGGDPDRDADGGGVVRDPFGDHPDAGADAARWRSRGQRRFDGLAHLCAAWLAGVAGDRPARPLLSVVVDRAGLDGADETGVPAADPLRPARLAWRGPGPVHLTSRALDRLACDAVLRGVLADGAEVLGVAAPTTVVSDELRAALLVRDGSCRFPGCRVNAPACHAHHVVHRRQHGHTTLDNLLSLCDHHHRLVHRRGWQVTLSPDGTATFVHGSRVLCSLPRGSGLRPPGPPPRRRRHPTRPTTTVAPPADPAPPADLPR